MQIGAKFNHYNINVFDLEKSLEFYKKALGFTEMHRMEAPDGSFILVFMGDGQSDFMFEITWLRDWEKPYEQGDNENHLCISVSEDYEKVREFHRENGWICYENPHMGIYFINDPDDYWVEIIPERFKAPE